MILDVGRKEGKCKLIYFYSSTCEQCSLDHLPLIRKVMGKANKKGKHELQIYDLDHETMPKGLKLLRVPELVEFCEGRVNVYGGIFTNTKLKQYVSNLGANTPIPPETESAESSGSSSEL